MARILVGLAFVCCLAAASAVTAIITSGIVTRDLVADDGEISSTPPTILELGATPARTAEAASAVPVAVEPPPVEAESNQPAVADPSAAAAELATADPGAFVGGLSPEQKQKLAKALLNRRLVDIRKQNSYTLPTDYRLRGLARMQNGRLALDEAQQKAVATIRETFRPVIDDAIGDVRDRDEDVRRRLQQNAEAHGPGTPVEDREGLAELQQGWRDVRQEMREAKAEVDRDYLTTVKGVLTPEQNAALDDVPLPPGLTGGSDNRP